MKAYQKIDGGVLMSMREYDIAETTVIKPGQVVQLSGGLVAAAAAAQTGAVLGIAAEGHAGAEDALNPRANGTKILVYDDPDLVFRCQAPVGTAGAGSTATTVVIGGLGAFAADDFNGGWLVLLEKGADSTNTDPVGTARHITDFAITSGTGTFTVPAGGTASAGDKFAVFPPVGFAKGKLSADAMALVLTDTAALALKVVGRKGGDILMMARKHALGAGE